MNAVSKLAFACALSLSGCILLLDTEKLHSETGSGGGAGATSGAAGESGKAGKSGKGGGPGVAGGPGMGVGGAAGAVSAGGGGGAAGMGGSAGSVCLDCLAIKCANEINACNGKPACKACFGEMNKPASCTTDPTYLAFVGCACVSCSMDCKLSCGAAGKGGGLSPLRVHRRPGAPFPRP